MADVARANSDGDRRQAGFAVHFQQPIGAWAWQASLGYHLSDQDIDAYRETGGAGLALAVAEQSIDSRQLHLDVQLSRTSSHGFGVLQSYLAVGGRREFADDARQLAVAFAGDAAGSIIEFATAAADSGWGDARLGLSVTWTGGISGFVELNERFGHRQFDQHGINLGLRREF